MTVGVLLPLAGQAPVSGQPPVLPVSLPAGSRLFIAPMDWNLPSYIGAEIRRQGLPVQVVERQEDADFVMTGASSSLGSRLISPGHYIQVKIVAANGGKQVWSAEANDYALFFARLRPHGPGRAARSIVTKMRNRFFQTAR